MNRKIYKVFCENLAKISKNLRGIVESIFFTVRGVHINRRFGTLKREGGMLPTGSLTAEYIYRRKNEKEKRT